MVICTTVVVTTFFENPYMKDLLTNLEPKHKPVYWKKLGQLIMVINEIVKEDVSVCFSLYQYCTFTFASDAKCFV